MTFSIFSNSTRCPYSCVKVQEDKYACKRILVCQHPNYLVGNLSDTLNRFGKYFIPNRECQFVRDLDYTQCPLFNLSKK